MKILTRLVGTLSGSAFQIDKKEDTKLLFDALDKIQYNKSFYFDNYEFDKNEGLYDSERAFNEYILIDSNFAYYLTFFWEESDFDSYSCNHSDNYFLKVPRHFFIEEFGDELDFIQLSSL